MRPGLTPFKSPDEAIDKTAFVEGAASTIGTPDDLVKTIKNLMQVSGGVGAIVGFVHDWANPENTRRSWDMVARYVVPEINGYIAPAAALPFTGPGRIAIPAANAPDLQEAAKQK
jgi:limonene 1,2-monooxygenase